MQNKCKKVQSGESYKSVINKSMTKPPPKVNDLNSCFSFAEKGGKDVR